MFISAGPESIKLRWFANIVIETVKEIGWSEIQMSHAGLLIHIRFVQNLDQMQQLE